jgi:hypothetical protein
MRNNEPLSVRDKVFGVLAAFSALYAFAVSFVLSLPSARQRFSIALIVFVISFSFVHQKKGVTIGILAFIALRFAWSGLILLLQH